MAGETAPDPAVLVVVLVPVLDAAGLVVVPVPVLDPVVPVLDPAVLVLVVVPVLDPAVLVLVLAWAPMRPHLPPGETEVSRLGADAAACTAR